MGNAPSHHDWEREQEERRRWEEHQRAEEARYQAELRAAQEAADRARAEQEAAMRAAREAEERARAEREAWERAERARVERERREYEERMRRERERAKRERLAHEARMREERERAERERAEREERARIEREREEAARLEREARLREAEERARREHEKREAERRAAEEEARQAKLRKEAEVRAAKEEEERMKEAQRKAEEDLRKGIRPEVVPTDEEIKATKQRLQYNEGCVHFAIAGISGSGKSSLINAFRGLRNNDQGAAPTGVTETTAITTRYPDPNRGPSFVWYDVPGAGTLNIPEWKYFNSQGLYVFDCIIVLFDIRFTAADIAILKHCARFKVPAYIVRSKSNQHILNLAVDMGWEEDEDDDEEARRDIMQAARDRYIQMTRETVKSNLKGAGLADQRCYIVGKDVLRAVVRNEPTRDIIDEKQLVEDLLTSRRPRWEIHS